MSRAFVKEPDADQAESDLPERPQSDHPNYMTQTGLEKMQSTVDTLRQERSLLKKEDNLSAKSRVKVVEADLRYLEKRIQCAIPVDVSKQKSKEIRFGATAKLVDEYVGTVRINARGGRYFEPAPEFNVYAGLNIRYLY